MTSATLFMSLVPVFLPARVLRWSGITAIPAIGAWQILGMAMEVVGAAIAVWCILTVVFVGKGTPAPFDPPQRLVVWAPTGSYGIRCTSGRVLRSRGAQ